MPYTLTFHIENPNDIDAALEVLHRIKYGPPAAVAAQSKLEWRVKGWGENRRIIEAIKYLRQIYGTGLKEAKEILDYQKWMPVPLYSNLSVLKTTLESYGIIFESRGEDGEDDAVATTPK